MHSAVAVYWDFENIHATLCDQRHQRGHYQKTAFTVQEPLVDIAAIMGHAASLGGVAINKAYGNWQWFSRYRDALNLHGLDLIQLFPRGMKNGADIRLALDVLEDLQRFAHIGHVVIVSSDSDFVSLAQKVRQGGRRVTGIGLREVANPFWVQCCDEFKFYGGLTAEAYRDAGGERDEDAALALEEGRALFSKALLSLAAEYEQRIPRSRLKQLMLRLDPGFDEKEYGFATFSRFVSAFADLAENIDDDAGGLVVVNDEVLAGLGSPSTMRPGEVYERILRRGNVRPIPPAWQRAALTTLDDTVAQLPDGRFGSFEDFEQRLGEALHRAGVASDEGLIHRLRLNLFALRMFRLYGDGEGIGLQPAINGESMLEAVDRETVRRIQRHATPPVDVEALALVLFGAADEAARSSAGRLLEALRSGE